MKSVTSVKYLHNYHNYLKGSAKNMPFKFYYKGGKFKQYETLTVCKRVFIFQNCGTTARVAKSYQFNVTFKSYQDYPKYWLI